MKKTLAIIIILLIFSCKKVTKISESKNTSNISKELKKEQIQTDKATILIPKNIEGTYTNSEETECNIKLIITKKGKEYFYQIKTDKRILNGKISFCENIDEKESCLNFSGIEWAENNGQLDENGEPINDNLKLPIGIEGTLNQNKITIQNYGNSMNNYIKLNDCEDKYIILKK